MTPSLTQAPAGLTLSWITEKHLCYIAHIWAEKETETEELQDFDFSDMATAAKQFIDSQPDGVEFISHIENCFDVLVKEYEGSETHE
jgi:hypothetical protein